MTKEQDHQHSNDVTHYTALLTRVWDRLSDHHQLDTDRAKRILDLQTQLERLDVRLIADPFNTALIKQLEQLFTAIDTAVESVHTFLDDDDDDVAFVTKSES